MRVASRMRPETRGKRRPGQNVYAATASYADVQTAVTAANVGDVVIVPAGEATWTSYITLSKAISVVGNGTTLTPSSPNATLFVIASDSAGVGHFTCGTGNVVITSGQGWRVHHLTFVDTAFEIGVQVNGQSKTVHPYGLIDHCTFTNMRVVVYAYAQTGAAALDGQTHWSSTLGLGTADAVYVEDCTFTNDTFGNVMDSNYGGRYVFRHNTVTDAYLEAHSVQGHHRSCRKWEIYENTIAQVNETINTPMFLRGGTGVVFNNTVTGTFNSPIAFDCVRAFTDPIPGSEPGLCDGDSPWDGNLDQYGYWARDQIGRSTDVSVWPAAAPYPAQALDAAYVWNNTINAEPLGVYVAESSQNLIQANRDYYVNAGAKPGYAAYTYPHPVTLLVE